MGAVMAVYSATRSLRVAALWAPDPQSIQHHAADIVHGFDVFVRFAFNEDEISKLARLNAAEPVGAAEKTGVVEGRRSDGF